MDQRSGSKDESLRRVVLSDLKTGEFGAGFRRDFSELYRFYLDEETRERLARKGPVARALSASWRILRAMLLRLSPSRRLLLLASILIAVTGMFAFRLRTEHFSFDVRPWGYLILLLVLMLELKDKLLARDEIAVARAVQLALLPQDHPEVDGWSVWSYTRPANDVGGDLVDYLTLPGGRIGVVLGDVSGKGLGAALLSAKLQATLQATASDATSLAALGNRLNAVLHRDGLPNRFATLFYAEIEPRAGGIRYLNAGHDPALVVRSAGIEALAASSYPLGMLAEAEYREGRVELRPGDALVIHSDGVTEARNPRDEEFGEERLHRLARGIRDRGPREAVTVLIRAIDAFLEGARAHDDVSVVVLRRESGATPD